jgi:site-specific recombinase XerD
LTYNNLEKKDIEKVLHIAYRTNTAHHLMILLAAQHGMRISEVAGLTLADVKDNQIRVRRVKGSLTTLHPQMENENYLFDERAAIQKWLQERPEDASKALFPSRNGGFLTPERVGDIITSYLVKAAVEAPLRHAHALKHACCSQLVRKGVGIEYVRTYVGHVDIKNTARYLNITDSEAAQKAQEAFR